MDELRPRFYPSKSITWKDRTKSNKASELLLSCKSRVAMAVGRLTDMWLWRSSPDCFYATLSTWLANFSLSSECSEKKWVRIELSGVLVASTTRRTVTGRWWEVRRGAGRRRWRLWSAWWSWTDCSPSWTSCRPAATQIDTKQSVSSQQSAVSQLFRHRPTPQRASAWPGLASPCPAEHI